jgi:hypothetical protein
MTNRIAAAVVLLAMQEKLARPEYAAVEALALTARTV